jgi:DNA primase large subunit
MFRQDFKKATVAKKHFTSPAGYHKADYPHRLNFYDSPPTAEITLDQFEQWAIDRLRGCLSNCVTGVGRLLIEWVVP